VENFEGDVAVLMVWLRCSCSTQNGLNFLVPNLILRS
jgi:hypothetical protein